MIVIHPADPTTEFLKALYSCKEGAELYTQAHSNAEIRRALNRRVYPGETIMMLGHGCEYGLFANSRQNRRFDRLIVNTGHVQFLRNKNCIGIWCNADGFAERYGLHGLFTGMIISEVEEAVLYNIMTTSEEIAEENDRLVKLTGEALQKSKDLSEIPEYIRTHAPMNTPLQRFNYNNFHYFP